MEINIDVWANIFLDPDQVAIIIKDYFVRQGLPVESVMHGVFGHTETPPKREYKTAPLMGLNNSPFFSYTGATVQIDSAAVANRFTATIPDQEPRPEPTLCHDP